jgi:HKD family nuclease
MRCEPLSDAELAKAKQDFMRKVYMTKKIEMTIDDKTVQVDRWGIDEKGYVWYENDRFEDGVKVGVELEIMPLCPVSLFIPQDRIKKEENN